MRHGSVFSGIGGIDLGFERAGIETVFQCEVDPWCQRVLMNHWPKVRLYDDVKELILRAEVERVDVLTGGFPCQDISLAGGRAGLAGNRSGLYFAFMELVASIRPAFVLVENVTGLLSSNGTEDLGAVTGTLEELGYGWAYRTLDSRYFGVAQRRRRVFVVGRAGGSVAGAAEVLFESEGVPWDPRTGREDEDDGSSDSGPVEEGVGDTSPVSMRYRQGKPGGGKGALVSVDRALTLATGDDQLLFQPVGVQQNQRHEVIVSDKASALTTGGGKPGQGYAAVYDGYRVRQFTPLEKERLQGFPEGWTQYDPDGRSIPDDDRGRMLGNAVTVPVAEWIGRRMVAAWRSDDEVIPPP